MGTARYDNNFSVSSLIFILQLVFGKAAPLGLCLSLLPKPLTQREKQNKGGHPTLRELEGMPENIFIFTTLIKSAQTTLLQLEESAACFITANILKDHWA